MTRRLLACALLLALPLAARGEDKDKDKDKVKAGKRPAAATNAAFEKMKKLAGTWLVADDDGKPTDQVFSIIKVTSGGSALHEVICPGQAEEMLSVYTVEGRDLVMTHYCVVGNQPRLKADPNSSANQVSFLFAGGANLDPSKDKHMHSMTITLVDADHIEVDGSAWEGGAPMKDTCCARKLVRKK